MRGVIKKLYAASLLFAALALGSYYLGTRPAAAAASQTTPECVVCFGAGDELKIIGGLLLVVALAVALAATMLRLREKREAAPPVSIIS